MEYFIFDVSVHSINLTSFLTFLFPPLSSFILIFLHSFGGLSILLSPPLSLSLSPTSPAPPSSCPAPSVMSLIHQPDSINRIPIAVCSLAARCCLCLYESITPTLTPTHCLWQIGYVCVCVSACVWILKPAQHYDQIYCSLCLEERPKHTQDVDTNTHTTAKMTSTGWVARPLGGHKPLVSDIISFSCLPLTLPYNNK